MSEGNGFAGWSSRRRRANVDGGRVHRHEAALNESSESPSERRDQFMQLSALQRLVGSVANNINQIARHANSTGKVPAEAAASIAHARAVIIRIDRQLAEMAGR